MLSGKTVEISNTDAEGRLVLADGVFYAKNMLKVAFFSGRCPALHTHLIESLIIIVVRDILTSSTP